MARGLSKSEYGAWMLYLSLVSFIEVARSGFLKNPIIRESQKSGSSFARIQSSSLLINGLFGLVCTGLLFVFRHQFASMWGAPELTDFLAIYFYGFWLFVLYSHLDFIQASNLSFRGSALGILAEKGSFFLGIILFLSSSVSGHIHYLAYIHLASVAIGIIVSLTKGWHFLKIIRKPSREHIRSLSAYGKYTLGTNLGAILLRSIDTWMIGWLMNPGAVATYNVAIRVANLFEAPTQALAQILFPKAVQDLKKEGSSAFKRLYERSVSIILLPTIPFIIVVMIFAGDIVQLLAGDSYALSADVLRVTILFGLLIPFSKQLGILLDADGHARENMLFVFRNALINTALNYFLIVQYGVMGAAFATALTFTLSLILDQRYASKKYGVSILGVFQSLQYWIQKIQANLSR